MTRVSNAWLAGRSTLTLVAADGSGRATGVPGALRELVGA
jgi:hypothetical protein